VRSQLPTAAIAVLVPAICRRATLVKTPILSDTRECRPMRRSERWRLAARHHPDKHAGWERADEISESLVVACLGEYESILVGLDATKALGNGG
jgi:hypothetical protein